MNMIDIIPYLTDDLRKSNYKGNPNPLAGHCYVASEVVYHFYLEDPKTLYKPFFIKHEGEPHWFLKDLLTGNVVDLTASQFKTAVPYEKAKRKGFLTKQPSRRAKIVLEQLEAE